MTVNCIGESSCELDEPDAEGCECMSRRGLETGDMGGGVGGSMTSAAGGLGGLIGVDGSRCSSESKLSIDDTV